MASTDAKNPLFILMKTFRKKYDPVEYKTPNNGKKKVPTYDGNTAHAESFVRQTIPKIRTLIDLMGWSKRDLADELEQEIITSRHSKLEKAYTNSGFNPDDGNDANLVDQFNTLMIYYLDELDGRDNAGNVVLNSCAPPSLSYEAILDRYGSKMDCKPTDVLSRVVAVQELALSNLAIADGTEPSEETKRYNWFHAFGEKPRYWFEKNYRDGGAYEDFDVDEIAKGMDVYFKE